MIPRSLSNNKRALLIYKLSSALKIKEKSTIRDLKSYFINTFNLSRDKSLDRHIINIGSKFCPKPKQLSNHEIEQAKKKLLRTLINSFHTFNNQLTKPPAHLKVESNWTAPITSRIQSYLVSFFNSWKKYVFNKNKLSWMIEDINKLKIRKDIRITYADKNLGMVIFNTEDYHDYVTIMLKSEIYQLLPNEEYNTLDYVKHRIHNNFDRISHLFNQQQLKYLRHDWNNLSYTSVFYCIPKMHKKTYNNLPFRPIVANRPTMLQSRVSKILSTILLPYLDLFPTILNSSANLVTILEQRVLKTSETMVSLDFVNLYSNIPLADVYSLLKSSLLFNESTLECILTCLKFICDNNYFIYNTDTYLQRDGLAMGTSVAPIIANLYLALKFDKLILTKYPTSTMARYIDDVFIIIDKTWDVDFFTKIASPIPITFTNNNTRMDFLDITIHNLPGRTLFTTVYQKPLNTYDYIPTFSYHPLSVIKGFIIGELTRYSRLTTFRTDFINIKNSFFTRLIKRGYKLKFLNSLFKHSKLQITLDLRYKSDLSSKKRKFDTALNSVLEYNGTTVSQNYYFVIRYSQQPKILECFKQHLLKLRSQILNQTGKNYDFCISYTKNKNVLQMVSSSALTDDQIKFIKDLKSPDSSLHDC